MSKKAFPKIILSYKFIYKNKEYGLTLEASSYKTFIKTAEFIGKSAKITLDKILENERKEDAVI